MHFLLPLDLEAIHEDAALLGLREDFLEVVMGHHLFLEVLHYLGSLILFIFVATHDGVQQSLPPVLTHIHAEVHGLVEFLEVATAEF